MFKEKKIWVMKCFTLKSFNENVTKLRKGWVIPLRKTYSLWEGQGYARCSPVYKSTTQRKNCQVLWGGGWLQFSPLHISPEPELKKNKEKRINDHADLLFLQIFFFISKGRFVVFGTNFHSTSGGKGREGWINTRREIPVFQYEDPIACLSLCEKSCDFPRAQVIPYIYYTLLFFFLHP
jgi:hypothetical protein